MSHERRRAMFEAVKEIRQTIALKNQMEAVKYSDIVSDGGLDPRCKAESIRKAREVASQLRKRNEPKQCWDELDSEAIFAINALVAFAEFQFNRANVKARNV